jgi:putative nucleotidyltransferase with HDIG domain
MASQRLSAPILAECLVEPLGRRWVHVRAVAARAEELASSVPPGDREVLVAAAWLHDIGYSPEIDGHTRFHPLDGARYLRETGWPSLVVSLMAHHSGARFEAVERGLSDELLGEFPFEDSPLLDALVNPKFRDLGGSIWRLTSEERPLAPR